MPIWICRTIFSISTIASSTRIPVTSVIPNRLIPFRVKPIHCMTKKVGMIDSGKATAAIRVARQFRRNRNTTITASAAPS